MASIWEMTAMLFRTLSSKRQQNEGIYLVFQIFILLAPLCQWASTNNQIPPAEVLTDWEQG